MDRRAALLKVLGTMPDEAFDWLAATIAGYPGRGRVWPDGTGGFSRLSQQSIAAAKAAARTLVEGGRG